MRFRKILALLLLSCFALVTATSETEARGSRSGSTGNHAPRVSHSHTHMSYKKPRVSKPRAHKPRVSKSTHSSRKKTVKKDSGVYGPGKRYFYSGPAQTGVPSTAPSTNPTAPAVVVPPVSPVAPQAVGQIIRLPDGTCGRSSGGGGAIHVPCP